MKKNRKGIKWYEKFGPVKMLIAKMARKEVLKQTAGHYPAPLKAIDVLEETLTMSLKEGLKVELEVFEPLAISQISKNLIELFFTSEKLKKETFSKGEAKAIQSAAVIGMGTMGSGIAWALTHKDIPVRLGARSMNSIAKAMAKMMQSFESIKRRGRLTDREIGLKMDRVTFATDMQGLAHADIVVEAVSEDPAVKKKIYETGEEIVVANIYILGNKYDLKDRQKCDIYNTNRADITCYIIGAEELYAPPEDFNNETYDVNSKDQYKVQFNVTPPYSDVNYVRNIRKAGEKDYYEADWGAGVAYASAHNKGMAKLVVLFPVSDELSTSSIPDTCFDISDIPRQKMCDLCNTNCPAARSSASVEKALFVAKANGHIVNPIYSFNCDYDYKPMFNTYFEIVNGRSTNNVCSEPVCGGCSVNSGVCFHPDCEQDILNQMNYIADETFGKVINLEDIQNLVYDITTAIDDNIEEYKFKIGEEYEYATRFVSERSLPLPNKLMTDAKLFIYPNKNEVA